MYDNTAALARRDLVPALPPDDGAGRGGGGRHPASDAVECGVAIQRALREHRRAHGFAPQVRIGIHAASASREGLDYRGRGVNAAARVGALAEGDEILATAETAALAATRPVTGLRSVTLKGFADPVDVASVQWR